VLKTLPDESVQCCVTSPPYWGLRDYGTATWDGGDAGCDHKPQPDGGPKQLTNVGGSGHPWKGTVCPKCGARRIDAQLGLEESPEAYVANMVEVFREVKRVLRSDGCLFLNVGDSMYAGRSASSYDRTGKEQQDSQGHDCLFQNLCDECQTVLLARKLHTSPEHVVELSHDGGDPIQDHSPLHCPCLDSSDYSHPSIQQQSYLANCGSRPSSGRVGEQPRASLMSTIDESSLPLQAAIRHCANCGTSLSGIDSTWHCVRLSAHMSDHDSSRRDDCTGDNVSLDARRQSRNQRSSISCSLRTPVPEHSDSYLYSTRKVTKSQGLKPKDLCGIPWLLAFALRADGWWLRSDIVWGKVNCMPESVGDRCTRSHEYVFMLTKSARYYYDSQAIAEPAKSTTISRAKGGTWHNQEERPDVGFPGQPGRNKAAINRDIRQQVLSGAVPMVNKRDVWMIPTESFKGSHYAVMPTKLAETCIKAGTSERGCCPTCGGPWERVVERTKPPADVYTGTVKPDSIAPVSHPELGKAGMGQKLQNWYNEHPVETLGWRPTCSCGEADTRPCVVLDPFSGAGTTGLVALRLNRDAILIELNPAYTEMARERCAQVQPVMMTT